MIAEIAAFIPTSYFFYSMFKEQRLVDRYISSVPIRIHVNGIRGKTTTTRLIGSILRPIFPTLTKTTGSEPKIIYPDGREELIKREGLTRISEQIRTLEIAHKHNVKSIVFECMAIDPLYQKILEEKIMKSTIGVITNVRYDHEDVMGESLRDIAKSLANTIPCNSNLVVPEDVAEMGIIQSIADKNHTTIHYAKPNSVPKGYAQRFSFMNFDENIAIALKVAEILGIERQVALQNMLNTTHDVGRGKVYTKLYKDKRIHFINSFANNDVESLVKMLAYVKFEDNPNKICLLNHRSDRERRTWSFINFICNYGFDSVVISSNNDLIEKELKKSGFEGEIITTTDNFIEKLLKMSDKKNNYWIGLANIKSPFADSVLHYFGVT